MRHAHFSENINSLKQKKTFTNKGLFIMNCWTFMIMHINILQPWMCTLKVNGEIGHMTHWINKPHVLLGLWATTQLKKTIQKIKTKSKRQTPKLSNKHLKFNTCFNYSFFPLPKPLQLSSPADKSPDMCNNYIIIGKIKLARSTCKYSSTKMLQQWGKHTRVVYNTTELSFFCIHKYRYNKRQTLLLPPTNIAK